MMAWSRRTAPLAALFAAAALPSLALGAAATSASGVAFLDNPPTDDLGNKYRKDSLDYAWNIRGEATEARASTHEVIAATAAASTANSAAMAEAANQVQAPLPAPVEATVGSTAAEVATAKSWEAKAQAVVDGTYQKSYDSAYAAGTAKINELKAGGAAYYDELLAAFKAKATPVVNKKVQAAIAAGMPYFQLQLQVGGVVATYMLKVSETIAGAKACVKLAFRMASSANIDQELGNGEMAYRKMIYAHSLIGKANNLELAAKGVYKLAREISATIPSYQQAQQNAAIAVMAGLQLSNTTRRLPLLAGAAANSSLSNITVTNSDVMAMEMFAHRQKHETPAKFDEIDQSFASFATDRDALDKQLGDLRAKAVTDTKAELAKADQLVASRLSAEQKGTPGKAASEQVAPNGSSTKVVMPVVASP